MRLKEYAKKHGVKYQTAWSWYKNGLITGAYATPSGSIIVPDEKPRDERGVILYARTSSSQNKNLLESQMERLRDYAASRGYKVKSEIKEIASGLNDERKMLSKILEEDDYDKIVVENKDRLTRFGFNWIQLLTKGRIEVMNETKEKDEDLVKDLISIIHRFSMRIYGLRRSQNIKRKLRKELELEETSN